MRVYFILLAMLASVVNGCASQDMIPPDKILLSQSLAALSAKLIDTELQNVAMSTRAIGEAYGRRLESTPIPVNTKWHDPILESQGVTTAFSHKYWKSPPEAMSPNAAI